MIRFLPLTLLLLSLASCTLAAPQFTQLMHVNEEKLDSLLAGSKSWGNNEDKLLHDVAKFDGNVGAWGSDNDHSGEAENGRKLAEFKSWGNNEDKLLREVAKFDNNGNDKFNNGNVEAWGGDHDHNWEAKMPSENSGTFQFQEVDDD